MVLDGMVRERQAKGEQLYRDLFFGQRSSIVKTGKDIFARDRRIFLKEIFDAVAAGKHPQNLIYRDACPLDAGLSVAHLGVNGNPAIMHFSLWSSFWDPPHVGPMPRCLPFWPNRAIWPRSGSWGVRSGFVWALSHLPKLG